MKSVQALSLILIALNSTMPQASAGTMVTQSPPALLAAQSPFDRGGMEFQALTGAFFSIDPSDLPTLNHSLTSWRLGLMLNDPSGGGILRGNYELLIEGFFGRVFEGPGDHVAGGMLQLRYNFVQPESKWVPYVQIGAGGFYSDIADDRSQTIVTQDWHYTVQTSIGIRRMLSHRWAFSVEGGYRHVSNGENSDRKTRLDSLGVQIGLCRFF